MFAVILVLQFFFKLIVFQNYLIGVRHMKKLVLSLMATIMLVVFSTSALAKTVYVIEKNHCDMNYKKHSFRHGSSWRSNYKVIFVEPKSHHRFYWYYR